MIAHFLTGIRLLLIIPVGLAFAYPTSVWGTFALCGVLVAIITDLTDGYAARRFGSPSAFGQAFDHTTDFLFVTVCLAALSLSSNIPLVLPIVIAIAFSQYVLDSYFLYRTPNLRMSWLGRWNGVLYFVPLVMVALARENWVGALGPLLMTLLPIISYLLIISTLASIIDRAIASFSANNGHHGEGIG